MKRLDKKITVFLGIIVCFIIGGTLSFESLARFSKKFEADKSISTAKFEVNAINTFSDVEGVMPGEEPIAEDKITLSNENDYPVEFTVKLKSKNEGESKNLLEFLNLTITIDNEIKDIQDEYLIRLEPNTVKDVFAKIEWKLDENGEVDADKASEATVVYSYDIKAKQLSTSDGNSQDIKSITLKDIRWNDADQNNIDIEDNYVIAKGNIDINLNNLDVNLNNEKLIFNADIELLGEIDNNAKGVNFSTGFKDKNNDIKNRLTYQLYFNENIYGRVAYTKNIISPSNIVTNGAEVIGTLGVKLTGEILKEGQLIYAEISILDRNGKKLSGEKTNCGGYYTSDILYIDIKDIIGEEGVKINSIEFKAVPKA